MLVYGNKTVQKSYYGDKKIHRAYLGNKLIFDYTPPWHMLDYNDYLFYDGDVFSIGEYDISRPYKGCNDAWNYVFVGNMNKVLVIARDTGLYAAQPDENLLCEGRWSCISNGYTFALSTMIDDPPYYTALTGIVDGELGLWLTYNRYYPDFEMTPLSKYTEKPKKIHGDHALTDSGALVYPSYIEKDYDGVDWGYLISGVEWKMRADSVVDFCCSRVLGNCAPIYLKQDGGIYFGIKNEPITNTDSTDVKFCDPYFIIDGVIHVYNGETLKTSNMGGFSAADGKIAIRDGVLFDISDLSNVVAIPDAPDNFVEVSRYAGRTDDNRIFQWKDNALKELILENAE